MYQVQHQSVANAIESDSRCFRALIDFGDFQLSDAGEIKWSKGSTQDDKPCIGSVVSTQGEMQIITIPDGKTISKGNEFMLYLYLLDQYQGARSKTWNDLADYSFNDLSDYTYYSLDDLSTLADELIPIGKFTVLSCKYMSDYYTVEFSDRLSYADKTYIPSLSFYNGWERSDDVMADIANQIGMTAETEEDEGYLCDEDGNRIVSNDDYYLVTSPFQFYMHKPNGYTMREVIGFIAAMRGKFAVSDRTGQLIQRWYGDKDNAFDVTEEKRHIDNLEIDEDTVYPGSLKCVISDNVTLQSGGDPNNVMEFTCPFMTKQRLHSLYTKVRIMYTPATLTQVLGDPRLELWDRFFKRTGSQRKELLMLDMDYTYDGGLMCDIQSGGND